MATLLLTAVGTAIGGPLGGSLGALIGNQVDRAVFGGGSREGPRLRELAISTSSYGQPIPRQFGRMRVPGTVIWSTDLIESKTKDKGGKGQPSTVTYSYSASFAVAMSSTPIARLGRIWADGNLLRGAQGDLKVGGSLRFYPGFGDHSVDPLIAADRGSAAPAFRDCAYVLFENLELGDFGNRIPALSFEVFADGGDAQVSLARLVPDAQAGSASAALANTRGFADEGGPLSATLAAIDQVMPLVCTSGTEGLQIAPRERASGDIITLPEQLSRQGDAPDGGQNRQRAGVPIRTPAALRYYDEERDYQTGVQRAIGGRQAGRELMIDLPATMTAGGARELANGNAQRARWQHETVQWRIGELDPRLCPGKIVRIPEMAGNWLVRSWEWLDRGVELELERIAPNLASPPVNDPGIALAPIDQLIPVTELVAVEVPADGSANPATPLIFAAASAENRAWRGAALYAVQGSVLQPLGTTGTQRSVIGALAQPLAASQAVLFEPEATVTVELVAEDLGFADSDMIGLAAGANRVLIGSEVIQFAQARPLGARAWQLSGLLRGRGGTEHAAAAGHAAGTTALLLDDALIALDPALVPPLATTQIAAIGTRDTDAVIANLANPGLSRRPLAPVHPQARTDAEQALQLGWTRRARGQWRWDDGVDVPLVEEREQYLCGFGPVDRPYATWLLSTPELRLTQADQTQLRAAFGPSDFWVRQVGTFDQSPALRLASLP